MRSNDKVTEFLPGALLIQDSPPHPLAKVTGRIILTMFALAVGWAILGQVDIVARAEGKLTPIGQVKSVQSITGGEVAAINIKEGDLVLPNQLLMQLDDSLIKIDESLIVARLEKNQREKRRVENFHLFLIGGKGSVDGIVKHQRRLLIEEKHGYNSKIQQLNEQLKVRQNEKQLAEISLRNAEAGMPILTEQFESAQRLLKTNLIDKQTVQNLELKLIELKSQVSGAKIAISQATAAIKAINSQIDGVKAETLSTTLKELLRLEDENRELNKQLIKIREERKQFDIRSPIAGRVTNLEVTTIGGVISPTQNLMTIVPTNQPLNAEAWLENKDIGFVHIGQPAEIKVHAFPFTKYGVIDAVVTNISANSEEDRNGQLVYKAELKLASNELLVNGANTPLAAGMTVSTEMKTGKRTLIEYLLTPLLRAKEDSVEER